MTRTQISAKARWFSVATTLAIASSVGSVWRPDPSTPPTLINLAKLLPPIFTASSAQVGPTLVPGCTGDATTGSQYTITLKNFIAISTSGAERVVRSESSAVNFAGTEGAITPEKFFQQINLVADSYKAMKVTMLPTLSVKGKITCVVGGQ